MKELYNFCRQLVTDNYQGHLSERVFDFFTVTVMVLYIKDPKLVGERMPSILQRTDIYADKKSIAELVDDVYADYFEGEVIADDDAMVIRSLTRNEDGSTDEDWSMFVSLFGARKDAVNLIGRSAHELVHLLRFNGIKEDEKEVKIRDGVSISRYNKETGVLKQKHFNFEEGIVENYTADAMNTFYEFIKDENVSFSPCLTHFKNKFKTSYKPAYESQTRLIDLLSQDSYFKTLIADSFYDTEDIPPMITYYNSVLGSPAAFSNLSRDLDNLYDAIGDGNDVRCLALTQKMEQQVRDFVGVRKVYQGGFYYGIV